jgi:hypothetical protein
MTDADRFPVEADIGDAADRWRKEFLRCGPAAAETHQARRARAVLCEYWKLRGERPPKMGHGYN